MQTIKTAVVVVLLLGVCYGAYVALNAPEPVLPPELEAWSGENGSLDLAIEEGAAVSIDIPQLAGSEAADLGSLAPPNLSPIESPKSASNSGADSLGLPPSISLPPPGALLPNAEADKPTAGQLASVGVKSGSGPEPGLAGLDLPPGVEGTSVPLPGAEASAPTTKALTSTTTPEISFPG